MAYTPDDLKDAYQVDANDKDYTLVTVTDLNPGQNYKFQFAYKFADNRETNEDSWSITKTVTASTEAEPNPPQFLSGDLSSDTEKIFVQWNGVDNVGSPYKGVDRVEVFISDSNDTFGDGTKPVTFFKVAGKKSIVAPAGEYTVSLKAVTLLGTYSDASTSRTITVEAQPVNQIEAPTLPTGLTAESIAFGIRVNWDGTYSGSQAFSGFKSINIYAVNSNLGATATSGITNSNQVATLSVNNIPNSSNIGLGTYVGYSQDTYLYYIAVNENNVYYSVAGIPTYTRINSSALRPNKANYVDLANGVISIENLVAGNGQFQSWLRAGAYNGFRIELSGLTESFTDGYGKTIYPGISIWNSSGSSRSFYADPNGNVVIGSGSKKIEWDGSDLSITNSASTSIVGGGSETVVTTLGTDGKFSIIGSGESYYDWSGNAIEIATGVRHTKLNPGTLSVSLDNDPNGSLFYASEFSISALSDEILFNWSTDTPLAGIRWAHYDYASGYDSQYTFGLALGGTNPSRSLVVSEDGTQFIGHRNYYGSATSSTMSSATFGVDGDFYYSTNES